MKTKKTKKGTKYPKRGMKLTTKDYIIILKRKDKFLIG